jgi:hypothetical protein
MGHISYGVYADDVNLFGHNRYHKEALIEAGLDVNMGKTKYMLMLMSAECSDSGGN